VGSLKPIQLLERGALEQIRGLAIVTELPSHIPQRMARRAENLLAEVQLKVQVQARRLKGVGAGAGIFLTADHEHTRTGFGAIGKPGLPAEQVAANTVQEFLDFHKTGMPVDLYLADQLLLPAALASSARQYRSAQLSLHLSTNAWVVEQFGLAKIAVDPIEHQITIIPSSHIQR
jgi:RNA 3'-terminal phosphate cyclase (ATP)